MKAKIYALYKGDTNICDGTLAEISARVNISKKTLSFYGSPAYARRAEKAKNPKPRLALVLIDE